MKKRVVEGESQNSQSNLPPKVIKPNKQTKPASENQIQKDSSQNQEQIQQSTTNSSTQQVQSQTTQQQQQQPEQKPRFSIMKMIFIYFLVNQVISYFQPKKSIPGAYKNVFETNDPLEIKFYISKSPYIQDYSKPSFYEKELFYNYNATNYKEINLTLPQLTLNDKLYGFILVRSLKSPDSINYTEIADLLVLNSTFPLIVPREKVEKKEEQSLLFKEEEDNKKNKQVNTSTSLPLFKKPKNIQPHLRQNIWILLVHDTNEYVPQQIPPQIRLSIFPHANVYQPILDTRQFWLRDKDYICLDNTTDYNQTFNLTVRFNTYWIYKYIMEVQLEQAFQTHEEWGIDSSTEQFKEMILDTNPYFFGITMIVSVLHMFFEFLAVKNDIAFWRNLDSHKGISLRTLYYNFVMEIVVFLYLLDNETSNLILFSSGIEIILTIWKIIKTTKFKIRPDGKFPFIEIDHKESYKSQTAEYDSQASKYLTWILFPLLGGYTLYSIFYEKHKGWYSFVINTLVGFIYVFGFINMTPQLYINFKLKSVEHLPWRTMIYKFLNTIIDDLFAFVITMPWLKRLSCFRDDVIFLVYLYQRWIYRVDKNRTTTGFIKHEGQEAGDEKVILEDDKQKKD